MKKMLFKMTMGLGIMALAAQQVHGRARAPGDDVVKQLAGTYGETRRGIGIARQGTVMEVYASDHTRSWTSTITLPDGITCLVASGQGFEAVAEALPPNV